MSKIIRKLRPIDHWHIGSHESWFSDMAAEGLHLKKIGFRFAQFVQGDPQKTRYRIDVSSYKQIPAEQKQIYADNGWMYVTSYGEYNVFSSPEALHAPELHTDPAEQSYTLNDLHKKFIWSALFVVLATALGIGMMSAVWFMNPAPTLALVEGHIIQQILLTIYIISVAYTSLRAAVSIRTLRKDLLTGKPINHHAPWRKQYRAAQMLAGIYIVLLVFVSILPMIQLAVRWTKTLPPTSVFLPIVRLAEVEQSASVLNREVYLRDNVDWSNRVTYTWSLFAPTQFQTDEHGIIPDEMWEDGSGVYTPSIRTRAYQLRFPAMAERLIDDLMKRYGMIYKGGDFIQVEHADFDRLIVHEGEAYCELFASKGKGILHVQYFGYAPVSSLIKTTVEKISLLVD